MSFFAVVALGGARPEAFEGAAEQPIPGALILPARASNMQLTVLTNMAGAPRTSPTALRLEAFGEILLAPAREGPGPTAGSTSLPLETLLVNGSGADTNFGGSLPILQRVTSADWEYASLDLTPAYRSRLVRYHRHLLHVQPDLFVVYDDLQAAGSARFELVFHSAGQLSHEPRSGNLVVEMPKAGFSAHCFTSPLRVLGPWQAQTNLDGTRIASGPTNSLAELRVVTVFMPHEAGHKRGNGFRLLESTTSIGLRVYRDGLPTLIAFNTAGLKTEANLTGLKFQGPLAIDIFRPRRPTTSP
jgi:hypothetical protein